MPPGFPAPMLSLLARGMPEEKAWGRLAPGKPDLWVKSPGVSPHDTPFRPTAGFAIHPFNFRRSDRERETREPFIHMTYKIMIVDDEPANLRLLERLFRRDYQVITATSGAEALALLNHHDVALLLTDQRMPG